jgi:hypothetical protein
MNALTSQEQFDTKKPRAAIWTDDELNRLKEARAQGLGAPEIAKIFGRGLAAVKHRISVMGLWASGPPQPWSEDEIANLKALADSGKSSTIIASILSAKYMTKRTGSSVISSMRRRGWLFPTRIGMETVPREPSTKPMVYWSVGEVTDLFQMIDDGFTASQVSKMLSEKYNTGRTRNAVLGYAHRHGKPFSSKRTKRPSRVVRMSKEEINYNRRMRVEKRRVELRTLHPNKHFISRPQPVRVAPRPMPNEHESLYVRFEDITSRQCHFIGAADTYCGHDVFEGPSTSSYCEFHYRLCYRPRQVELANRPHLS